MATNIYKVIKNDIYDDNNEITVKVFDDKQKALDYFNKEVSEAEPDAIDNDYVIDKGETSYEQYEDGYESTNSLSIYIEEDILN